MNETPITPITRKKIIPITPDKVAEERKTEIPETVIDAFNTLIKKRYDNVRCSAYVTQEEVIRLILSLKPEWHRQDIFDNHWLNVEPLYEHAGWKVEYYKTDYHDDIPSSLIFTKK